VPLVIRLPDAGWYVASWDYNGDCVWYFEEGARAFVREFLQPGMTMLDVGAHVGLYSLIAARKVGPSGRVIAFEPSPRERRALRWNRKLNRCTRLQVEPLAVGAQDGTAVLFVSRGFDRGTNSLRGTASNAGLSLRVRVTSLDEYLTSHGVSRVDLLKIDVEGGELDAFAGAARLLSRPPRPVILCELSESWAIEWGHGSRDVRNHLSERGFSWFQPQRDGSLARAPTREHYEQNSVAVPEERLTEVLGHHLSTDAS